jgi:hypothetical protein
MPIVDVVVRGQVIDQKLRYKLPDAVRNVERLELLGYSIRRTHGNISELNNCLDFKIGSTALSGLRVTAPGAGYDPDSPPRIDDAAELGVRVYVVTPQLRRERVMLPDYAEVTEPPLVVRHASSREFGDESVDVVVAPPYGYPYRLLYRLSADDAGKAAVDLADYTPVLFSVEPVWFELEPDACRARIVAAHNAASAAAFPAGDPPELAYVGGLFQLQRATGPFAALDHATLAHLLCGTSARRHRQPAPPVQALRAGIGTSRQLAFSSFSPGSSTHALVYAEPPTVAATAHDARLAAIAESLRSARATLVEAELGAVYTARLRPGQYHIGTVLHAPYPVVLGVEEARTDAASADPYDASQAPTGTWEDEWYELQRHYGLVPRKALGITRRQAADGLIKELQDAMNYAVNAEEIARSAPPMRCVDSGSLCALFPQYTHLRDEVAEPYPFVYDTNVPHVDNPHSHPAFDHRMLPYTSPYDVGHQPTLQANRRRQSVYVTLEDAGGGVDRLGLDFATHRASLETAGWNGLRAGRVRITTRENRVLDELRDRDTQVSQPIARDADARPRNAIAQKLTLLFQSGPNSARSVHRVLGFLDGDRSVPETFLLRKPAVAVRDDALVDGPTAGTARVLVERPGGGTAQVHVPNVATCRRDAAQTPAVGPMPDGLVYTDGAPWDVDEARRTGVVYTRYVAALAVTVDETGVALEDRELGAAAAPLRDVDLRYRGGTRHFEYYEVLGYQAPHPFTLDSDPLVLAVGVALNDRRHTDAERVQAAGLASFALLPIGMGEHAEPKSLHDGSAYQSAMLSYKLSGYATAPHAVGVDRTLSGFRNFGRAHPNAQEPKGRRFASNAEGLGYAARDAAPASRCIQMLKTGDFGVKSLTLDEPVTLSSMTFTFGIPDVDVPYNFGAQEVILLVRIHTRGNDPMLAGSSRANR